MKKVLSIVVLAAALFCMTAAAQEQTALKKVVCLLTALPVNGIV
jgi:hypothetical protein